VEMRKNEGKSNNCDVCVKWDDVRYFSINYFEIQLGFCVVYFTRFDFMRFDFTRFDFTRFDYTRFDFTRFDLIKGLLLVTLHCMGFFEKNHFQQQSSTLRPFRRPNTKGLLAT